MDREEVIRMARDAGAAVGKVAPDSKCETIWPQCMDVYRFASLVAAAERERIAKIVYDKHTPWPNTATLAAAIRAIDNRENRPLPNYTSPTSPS